MRMHVSLLSIIVIGFAAGVAAETEAGVIATITTADGNGADARVRGGTGATFNFGGSDIIAVSHGPAGSTQLDKSRKSYLRFDLTPLAVSAVDAELQVTLNQGFTIVGTVTFQLYGLIDTAFATENWLEGIGTGSAVAGITWNNAPANNTGSPNGFTAGATLLGSTSYTGSFAAGQTLSFSYASIASFINADTNDLVTFMLTSQNINPTNNYTFGSSEGGDVDPPTLIISVPEPSSLALLGFGLVGLVGFARRKNRTS